MLIGPGPELLGGLLGSDVVTGGEHLALAGEDDDPARVVGLCAAKGLVEFDEHPPVLGVALVRAVNGHWQCEAVRDIRPQLAQRIVAAGGALRNLDLRRARLDEAYGRDFREVHQ